ncbi:MAG: hypothetical protein O3A46_14285, partial [Candidatus Poribacteria bacterium]|nr:hypothetical protein [Candidatus Poribacteria bacterium]
YTTAGSFSRWLIETRGIETFGRAYPFGRIEKAYGIPFETLRDEWLAFIDAVEVPETEMQEAERRFDRPPIFAKACAREIASLESEAWERYRVSDFDEARELFTRIRQHEPQNPEWTWRIVQVELAAERWEDVLNGAKALIGDERASDSLKTRATDALGDASWHLGDVDAARDAYTRVIDADAYPSYTRGAWIKRDARSLPPESQALVQQYFAPSDDSLRLYRMRELTARESGWAHGHYLLGRALFAEREWEAAALSLEAASALGLPTDDFNRETQQLVGRAHLRQQRWDDAKRAFADALTLSATEGERLEARDWLERLAWQRGESNQISSRSDTIR